MCPIASETTLTSCHPDTQSAQSPIPTPAFKNEEEKQLYMSGKQLERNTPPRRGFETKSSESPESNARGIPGRRVSLTRTLTARLGKFFFL